MMEHNLIFLSNQEHFSAYTKIELHTMYADDTTEKNSLAI